VGLQQEHERINAAGKKRAVDLPWPDSREDQSSARSDGVASRQPARGLSERNPERRWAAIGRTYTEDVTCIDPDGEFAGWQALSDQAQKLLDGLLAGYVFEEDGPTYVGTDTAALAWRFGPPGKPIARP
jgi:hypothetical protein